MPDDTGKPIAKALVDAVLAMNDDIAQLMFHGRDLPVVLQGALKAMIGRTTMVILRIEEKYPDLNPDLEG